MKKHVLTLVALLVVSFAMAGNFVNIKYSCYSDLQKLFADKNLVVHFYTDSQVFATAEHFDASSMTMIDENAFGDCEVYTLLYGTDYQQEALYRQPDFVVVKGTAQPMKNDGAVAIFNREARLPKLTRDFPEVTAENPDIRYLMDQVSQDSMRVIVERLQAYQSRKWDSQNAFDASDWIKGRFEAMGFEEVEQQAFIYNGQNAAPNVIAIQRGTVNPDVYVVCGSHFDSFSFSGTCPGADDNATGVASVLETARLLSQYEFDFSIVYCAFGCEEMGLCGSEAYASRCREQGMDIIGYFNNDMNGYLYGNEVHIHQIYRSSSEPCGAFYRSVGAAYFPEMVIEHKNFSSGDSDHTSFNNNGYQGIYPFEDVDHYSPYIHSPGDTIGTSVNSWLMPQRYCQMNLGCVAECAVMHPRGPVVFNGYVLHDNGEQIDGKMNPGESIMLDVAMQNVFDHAVNGVNVTIGCNDENVSWHVREATFGDFAAGETKTVDHAFEFFLEPGAPAPANYRFTLVADNGTESCTSAFNITAYTPVIEYTGIVVLDDNGMLEPGETADLRFLIENVGNEIGFDLDAMLSTDSDLITVNNAETHVADALLNGDMAYADFNVTLSPEATLDAAIPFTLTVGNKTFEVVYKNSCNVVFALYDSYGDGWNGAALLVDFSDETPQQTLTVSGSSQVYTFEIGTGVEVSLSWRSGSWDSECSYSVAYEGGETIYSGSGTQSGTFFSWVNDCAGGSGNAPEFCGSVLNLNAPVDRLYISWDAPEGETPDSYDVYRETIFVANTTETEFQDNPESSDWLDIWTTYCVYPVYGNCQGEMACVEAYWDPLGVKEEMSRVNVYPNPAEHQVKIEAVGLQHIEVFNVLGQQMKAIGLGGQNDYTFSVEDLDSGLYLMRIVTNSGVETVRVVVK